MSLGLQEEAGVPGEKVSNLNNTNVPGNVTHWKTLNHDQIQCCHYVKRV